MLVVSWWSLGSNSNPSYIVIIIRFQKASYNDGGGISSRHVKRGQIWFFEYAENRMFRTVEHVDIGHPIRACRLSRLVILVWCPCKQNLYSNIINADSYTLAFIIH